MTPTPLLALLVPLLAGQEPQPAAVPQAAPKPAAVGDDVSWLTEVALKNCSGDPYSFGDWFKARRDGKEGPPRLLVISFFSTECPWQRMWNPDLAAICAEYQGRGVTMVQIDSNSTESAEQVRKFLKEQKLPFPVLMDPGNEVADRFGAKTTPHLYVVDATGKVIYTGAVDNDARDELPAEQRRNYLRDALDAALAGKAVAVASTPPVGCTIKRAPKKAQAAGAAP